MAQYGAIVAAVARLMWTLDHRDRTGFADSWCEFVDFEVTPFCQQPVRVSGRDEMVRRFAADWTGEPAAMRHQLGSIYVEMLGPRRARARYYCTYITTGAEPALSGMGEYDDEIVKEADGRWRVERRRHRFLSPLKH